MTRCSNPWRIAPWPRVLLPSKDVRAAGRLVTSLAQTTLPLGE